MEPLLGFWRCLEGVEVATAWSLSYKSSVGFDGSRLVLVAVMRLGRCVASQQRSVAPRGSSLALLVGIQLKQHHLVWVTSVSDMV